MDAKLFQLRLLKRVLKRGKRAFLNRDPRRNPGPGGGGGGGRTHPQILV